MIPSDWSRDGKYLLYSVAGDLWVWPTQGGGEPVQQTSSPISQEIEATFSPNGRWIAYQSSESTGISGSGQGDIFVQSFPPGTFKRQVSTGGGFVPRWSADGKELFYQASNESVMSVSVSERGPELEIGTPKPLFPLQTGGAYPVRSRYGIAKDGRLLMLEGGRSPSVTVILNWFEQLKGSPQTAR